MLRRSILRFSAVQSVKRIPIEVTTQVPSYLFSRREFSVSPKQNGPPLGPGSIGKPTETGSVLPRFIIGTVALSAGFFAAYQTGYLDKYHVKELHFTPELAREGIGIQDVKELKGSSEVSQDGETLGRPNADSKFVESDGLEQNESSGTRQDLSATEEPSRKGSESQIQVKDSSEITGEEANCTEVKESPPSSHQESMAPDEIRLSSTQSPEDTLDMKSSEVTTDAVQSEAIEVAPTLMQAETLQKENEASDMSPEPVSGRAKMEVVEDLGDAYKSKDGKLVLDFLQALHEAEMRQAEIDARLFAEEKKYMKGRYEKELKDARARELMYAEREALLDKELKKEREKAIAALKSLNEKLEEEHKAELEEKETEAELKLTKAQELCKAELDAAITREKASQIEKMAEANLHINALCMAFYARSEEARQSRSVHKLAVPSSAPFLSFKSRRRCSRISSQLLATTRFNIREAAITDRRLSLYSYAIFFGDVIGEISNQYYFYSLSLYLFLFCSFLFLGTPRLDISGGSPATQQYQQIPTTNFRLKIYRNPPTRSRTAKYW